MPLTQTEAKALAALSKSVLTKPLTMARLCSITDQGHAIADRPAYQDLG
ncbi:hypothetical protein ACL02S_14330 [Nocardia sp. 004]